MMIRKNGPSQIKRSSSEKSGISIKKAASYAANKLKEKKARCAPKYRPWTEEEDYELLYSGLSDKEFAKEHRRSIMDVQLRRRFMAKEEM